jgi:protoporphyrinogen oxidase
VKTAVLGGGLTGITLAHLLKKRGEEVVVLEREQEIGGLCRSRADQGFTFDIGGSHIIFSRDGEVLSFMQDVLGENRDERSRNTKIFYKGRYVKYPFENGLYQLPQDDCFFCINEFVKNLIAVEKGELSPPENFREWIYYTFGRGIAETYMVPYNEKIWNFPTEQMSLHWVDGRIPRPPMEDIIKSAIGIETEGYTHQSVFSYPVTGGIEALVHAIARPVRDIVIPEFPVRRIRVQDGKYRISDGRREIEADRIISTIPLQALLPCLEAVPPEVQSAVDGLRYNSLCCVFIGLRTPVPDYSWLYVPDPDLGHFNRISFPSNFSTTVTPEGRASILVEVTYNEGDRVSGMNDRQITDHVIEGLMKMNLIGDPRDVVYTGVERQQYAYVVYDLDYLHNIETIKSFCREQGIHLVGRFSEFEYLNMDGCIRRAFDFVRGPLCE